MVSVNIPDEEWKEFLKLCIDKNTSASAEITNFIKGELKKNEKKD